MPLYAGFFQLSYTDKTLGFFIFTRLFYNVNLKFVLNTQVCLRRNKFLFFKITIFLNIRITIIF